jgi:iron complex transport system permease protein
VAPLTASSPDPAVAPAGSRHRITRRAAAGVVLVLMLGASVCLAAGVGSVSVAPEQTVRVIGHHLGLAARTDGSADQIVWELRLPRALLAAVVGASLATAGVAVQALVRNSLADPYVLGVSSGASVGATAVLLFGALAAAGPWALTAAACLGAVGATASVMALSVHRGDLGPLRLILVGTALAHLFSAVTAFLVFRGDPRAARTVLSWLLGSFGRADWPLLVAPLLMLGVGLAVLTRQAGAMDALLVGDDTARALGVEVARVRVVLFVVSSLLTGASVAVAGAVGFVGLMVPHLARLIVGTEHRDVLPVAALLGAVTMVLGDIMAKVLVAPEEMPVGVVTAVLGAPLLIVLVRRQRSVTDET